MLTDRQTDGQKSMFFLYYIDRLVYLHYITTYIIFYLNAIQRFSHTIQIFG